MARTTGARSATGRRRPLGWLPWLLALLIAVLIAVVVLVVVNSDDDQDGVAAIGAPAAAVDQVA